MPLAGETSAPARADASRGQIRVRGAATHNLQHVDLDLPRGQMIVFCGVSGSGKTSMAVDTLYAEGQRRYIESFSAYTRQFLEQLDKPDVESIEGLPPAIAVTHPGAGRSNRTTVSTATEIADHMRLLLARVGEVVCPDCNLTVRQDSVESIVTALGDAPTGARMIVGFVSPVTPDGAGEWIAERVAEGYVRAIIDGRTLSLTPEIEPQISGAVEGVIVVDRLKAGSADHSRLAESVEAALAGEAGACQVLIESVDEAPIGQLPASQSVEVDGKPFLRRSFSTRLRCDSCGRNFAAPEPQLLNFNSPLGACPTCEGFGSVVENDMDLIVPDRTKSLREGAIAPWNTPAYAHELKELLALAPDYGIPVSAPFSELTPEHLRIIQQGAPERNFGGLEGFFRWLERRKYKMHLRVFLSRWRSYHECPTCGGARLNPDALAVHLAGASMADLCWMKVREAAEWFSKLELAQWRREAARLMLDQIESRLGYLVDVGVGYLTLDRSLRTLSTGEAQRVGMTSALGSSLVDLLYVLDEPSVGLHPTDVAPLAAAVTKLRDRGATVVVVEHEEEMLRHADQLVEFGPGAGSEGGRLVFQGTLDEMLQSESRTGDWLAGRRPMVRSEERRPVSHGKLTLLGASGNNLQNLDVEFPLGVLCVVSGVSGAGKSSLVLKTLYPALTRMLKRESGGRDNEKPLPHVDLLGASQIEEVVRIDQQPIGRSARSNPVTYIKAFDPIRAVFAEQPEAKMRGFTPSHFSFNVEGGRCEACEGAGYRQVDMQFLADVYMKCRECDGRRYRREVLEVRYRDRDISEVLEMTAGEAFRFFRGHAKVQAKLKTLLDVGLDYLPLGQPAGALSGGEAQRLKLANVLATKPSGQTLFVMDEPTTGLHFSDIVRLIDCFDALVEVGHSLIVVEHNVQLMLAADWLIDIGPGAAENGGRIVCQGAPEEVARVQQSATGRVLAEALERERAAAAAYEALNGDDEPPNPAADSPANGDDADIDDV